MPSEASKCCALLHELKKVQGSLLYCIDIDKGGGRAERAVGEAGPQGHMLGQDQGPVTFTLFGRALIIPDCPDHTRLP